MPFIRAASPDDVPRLCSLLSQLFALEEDFAIDKTKQEIGLSLLLRSDRAKVLVAEEQGSVIAMVSGQLLVSTAEGAYSMLVEDLIVDQAHRGKGIGESLLSHLEDWGTSRGATRFQLLADRDNHPAHRFYHDRKWKPTNLICLSKNRMWP